MMKRTHFHFVMIMLPVISLVAGSTGCGQARTPVADNSSVHSKVDDTGDKRKGNKMKIRIGSRLFNATLFDNPAATAFKAMLPLTIEMEELNGNEKKHHFSKRFPVDASNPGTINNGDLMIWGNNTLVLFYKTFPTRYSYTKLGKVEDPSELEAAVGKENVTVTFELD